MRHRSVFFGTPEFAVPALSALSEISELVAVVSQPDRPAGRGLRVSVPPVVQRARELGVEVYQPTRVRNGELEKWLAQHEPDVAVVAAYGRILPVEVLRVPRHGCINLHASLLPAYRGAAPIQWALLAGERQSGISLMQMDAGMDTGPVYRRDAIDIPEGTNAGQLTERLAQLAADVLRQHLLGVLESGAQPEPQDESRATQAPPLTPAQFVIDWSAPAVRINDQVRGLAPRPGAYTMAGARRVKVLKARVAAVPGEAGVISALTDEGVTVGCGEQSLQVLLAQFEGRTVQAPRELINGRGLSVGQRLG